LVGCWSARRETAETTASAPALESGIKASCDSCSADVTHNVHIRCAEPAKRADGSKTELLSCPDFDLCVPVSQPLPSLTPSPGALGIAPPRTWLTCEFRIEQCFLQGKQIGPHRPNHAYRVIDSHAFPIFDPDWGADEELLLIEGAEMYGLGNWADMAEHVGGRTKEECEEHYMHTYIESEAYPLPVSWLATARIHSP